MFRNWIDDLTGARSKSPEASNMFINAIERMAKTLFAKGLISPRLTHGR